MKFVKLHVHTLCLTNIAHSAGNRNDVGYVSANTKDYFTLVHSFNMD